MTDTMGPIGVMEHWAAMNAWTGDGDGIGHTLVSMVPCDTLLPYLREQDAKTAKLVAALMKTGTVREDGWHSHDCRAAAGLNYGCQCQHARAALREAGVE